jgi:hypothetical protein
MALPPAQPGETIMKTTIMGVFASVALLSSGAALAHGDKQQHSTQTSQQVGSEATGGSGMQAQQSSSSQLGEKQVSGTVLKSSGSELKLRTDNGIFSLKVDKNTQFQDPSIKKIKDLQEGQQVRTSFTVEKDANLARSVSVDSGMGGSGLESDPGINEGFQQDVGGSGTEQDQHQDLGGKNDVGGAGNVDSHPDMGSKTY